jgi:hypothetical protein
MRVISLLTFLFSIVIAGGTASADRWDSKGWVKLGERAVSGRVDRDSIPVGRSDGRFSKLTLVVEKSEIELLEFEIVFENGEKFNPRVQHYFRESSRTRVIDLPGTSRVIRTINLKYRNLPGGGSATVEVWGWKTGDAGGGGGGGGGGRPGWSFDSRGWTMLGERSVSGRVDTDRIPVGRYKGKFEKMTLVVLDSDLELLDLEVKFERGAPWRPGVRHYFKEGSRSHVIDFPGGDRTIKFIEMKYKNLAGGGAAKVQVWAK